MEKSSKSLSSFVDPYLGNISNGIWRPMRMNIRKFNRKENLPLLTIEKARKLAEETALDVYAVVSFGLFNIKGKYAKFHGLPSPTPLIGKYVDENNSKDFFYHSNYARFNQDDSKIPRNEFWYAMLGGDKIEALLEPLEENKHKFDGIKVGAFRTKKINNIDYRHQLSTVMDFCKETDFPVLMHCSAADDEDIKGVLKMAEAHPNVRICASHLGGDFYKNGNTDKGLLKKRTDLLKEIPSNLYLNLAVKDQGFSQELLSKNPSLKENITFGSDVPFLQKGFLENLEILKETFRDSFDQFNKNGKIFLGR